MSPDTALFAERRRRGGGRNSALDKPTLARAAAAAKAITSPAADGRGSAEYRTKMAGVMTARALARAFARANILKGPDMSITNVSMTVNGKTVSAAVEPRTLLIHYLRENLGLTGPHIGCDTTHCGACTVDVDGTSVKSCTMFAVQAEGAEVLTIEGMAGADGKLHALQEGFREMHGLQCGFCTPGMIMRAHRLLQENPNPTESEIRIRHFRQSLPLHRLPEHRQGHPIRRRQDQRASNQGSRGMNDAPTPTSLERAEKLQGMGCKRKRVEDVRFTQGRGNYVDDIKLPGMLHGDFHRSSHAHARIIKIDTSKAKAVPGVLAVLTAEDLKGVNLAWMPTLAGDVQMVLADGKVLFQNQEIAFVVATDRYIAADAADLVEVEYEELPVVVDPFKAMDADAPVLREDIEDKKDGAHGPRKPSTTISSTGRSATRS